jgi:heptosyltransferase-2
MRRILVLRGGALGDFIVTLPALSALRARWPAARIELAGNATAAELARARGLLDAVHSQHEARWSALFTDQLLPREFAAWLSGFDLVLSYWPDPDAALARHLPVRAGQLFLTHPAHPAIAPAAAHYFEPLRQLAIPPPAGGWLHPLASRRDVTDTVAVHPGSGSRRKNWPLDRWRAVLDALPSPILLVLGEAERDAHASLTNLRGTVEPAVNLPLEQLVARLSRCRLFVGHDSGVSHLAAACSVPCVLLFGPTDPAIWAPPAPHVRVLRRGSTLDAISVADVLGAIRQPQAQHHAATSPVVAKSRAP